MLGDDEEDNQKVLPAKASVYLPPMKHWVKPVTTYGGKTFWVPVETNTFFQLQEHKASANPRYGFGKNFVSGLRKVYSSRADLVRIVMIEKPFYCVASAEEKEELYPLWEWLQQTLVDSKLLHKMDPPDVEPFLLYLFNLLEAGKADDVVELLNQKLVKYMGGTKGKSFGEKGFEDWLNEAKEQRTKQEKPNPGEQEEDEDAEEEKDEEWDPFGAILLEGKELGYVATPTSNATTATSNSPTLFPLSNYSPTSKQSSGTTTEEKPTQKKEGTAGDEEENVCKICYENPITMAILDCGHMMLCEKCSVLPLALCPICRGPIRSIVKVYKC